MKEDVLDSSVLTRKVWDEIFELFKLHFSTEMPFLHPPTFRNRMRQAAVPRDPAISPSDLEESRVLLLGVLTLTARFHPGLIAHHSPNGSNPLAASEFYAGPLANALGPTIRHLSRPSIENIQALLMMGLYEWGQSRGLSAWLNIGMAIRLAFSMGLAYLDKPVTQISIDARTPLPSTCPRDGAMEKEVRRRTLWSCFIMDRMLSAGRNRPTMISIEKLAVQLPCSDDQFLFVHNGPTSFLSPKWNVPKEHYISSQDEGVLSWYLRLVEIFGDLSEWTHAGGRRSESLPPWDEATGFFTLRRRLKEFYHGLPLSLTFTEANLSAHIEKRNATTYASLHTLYSLCLIVLHREYIPFVPLRCKKPVGPLDRARYSVEKYDVPTGFWELSANDIMKASRDIIEIVRMCQDSNALPESPQIGFAIWQAAFVCVYILWFPKMDPEGALIDQSCPDSTRGMKCKNFLALMQKMLGDILSRLSIMRSYLKTIDKMHHFYFNVFREYSIRFKRHEGLEHFKNYERELREFSVSAFRDKDNTISETSEDQNRSRASTNDNSQGLAACESMSGHDSTTPRQNGSWAPINASSSSLEEERPKNSSRNQYAYGSQYQQQSPSSTVSNGDIKPNSLANNSQASSTYTSQTQHSASYPSTTIHTMAPLSTHMTPITEGNDQVFSKWIEGLESISMNTGLDNFAQELSMEQFTRSGLIPGSSPHQNFFQATWSTLDSSMVEFDSRGS